MSKSARSPIASRARVVPTRPDPNPSKQAATSVADAAAAKQALRDRGIVDPSRLLEFASPEAIVATCQWFDEQQGRVGLGVLVNEVKAGGRLKVLPSSKAAVRRSAVYQAEVWEWAAKAFPDLCDEGGLASPHVVAAVFRLHMVGGRGCVSAAEHGSLIRSLVERLEAA